MYICLSEELKDKCIAIIQKQIIMKISFGDEKLTKLQRESENSRGMVLASPSAGQTRRLASDFKS